MNSPIELADDQFLLAYLKNNKKKNTLVVGEGGGTGVGGGGGGVGVEEVRLFFTQHA